MTARSFDVIVIGAGPAGEVAAGALAGGGLEVAIVEDRLVGGECSFWACMPSKALLRPAHALAEVRRVPGAAQAAGGVLDTAAALTRRDEVIHGLDDSAQLPWLDDRGVTLVRGFGRLGGEGVVVVGDERLEARLAVILAVGTTPALPPIDGLAEASPWTNREATTAHEVPARLIVLGGGPVGCELAQAYATLGAAVTLLEAAPRLLAREEAFASQVVQDGLRGSGVTVRTGAEAERVRRAGGVVTLTLAGGETITADEILVAAGRRVQSGGLGLETVGLDVDPGDPIPIGADLRPPGTERLFVLGDANGVAAVTHEGKYQARLLSERLLGRDPGPSPAAGTGPLGPRVVFTEPQVAAVGHTEASALEAGISVRVAEADAQSTAGGSFHGKGTEAPCRLVIDTARDVVVGATFTGVDIAEFLHAATIAVAAEVPVGRLTHAVPAFPTRSEVWLKLVATPE